MSQNPWGFGLPPGHHEPPSHVSLDMLQNSWMSAVARQKWQWWGRAEDFRRSVEGEIAVQPAREMIEELLAQIWRSTKDNYNPAKPMHVSLLKLESIDKHLIYRAYFACSPVVPRIGEMSVVEGCLREDYFIKK